MSRRTRTGHPCRHRRRGQGILSQLRDVGHRQPRAAGRARRAQARASAPSVRHERDGSAATTGRTRRAPGSSGTCWASTIPTATCRSTMPWCGWPRISPCAIPWSTGRGTSAPSTATRRRPCGTPRRGWPGSPRRCSRTSTRRPWTSGPTTTIRCRSPSCCRRRFRFS